MLNVRVLLTRRTDFMINLTVIPLYSIVQQCIILYMYTYITCIFLFGFSYYDYLLIVCHYNKYFVIKLCLILYLYLLFVCMIAMAELFFQIPVLDAALLLSLQI